MISGQQAQHTTMETIIENDLSSNYTYQQETTRQLCRTEQKETEEADKTKAADTQGLADTSKTLPLKTDKKEISKTANQEVEVTKKSKKGKHYCSALMLNKTCACQELQRGEEYVCCCCRCNTGQVYLHPAFADTLARSVCISDTPHIDVCSSCPQSIINHTVTYTLCHDSSSSTSTTSSNT